MFLLLSCLCVSSESNGYGLALGLVVALSVGSVTIWMYPRIEPSIDSQECFFICVLLYKINAKLLEVLFSHKTVFSDRTSASGLNKHFFKMRPSILCSEKPLQN